MVTEERSWGAGLVIFTDRHRTDTCFGGLKNRYLPMNENLKVETIGYSSPRDGYTKEDLSNRLRLQTVTWYEFSATIGNEWDRKILEVFESLEISEYFTIDDISLRMRTNAMINKLED